MENIQLLVDSFWPMFKAGLLISVPLMLVSFVVGLVLAFVLALMLHVQDRTLQGNRLVCGLGDPRHPCWSRFM